MHVLRIAVSLTLSWCAFVGAGCLSEEQGIDTVFDPCAPLVLAPVEGELDEIASIDDAMSLWRDAAGVAVTRDEVEGAPRVPVHFDPAGRSFFGFYDDALGAVYINEAIDDDDARSVTIAHELGHAFGLTHVAPAERASLMNPGNLRVRPTAGDVRELTLLWGACGG